VHLQQLDEFHFDPNLTTFNFIQQGRIQLLKSYIQ